jgi:transcriptional regulator with XRE-family HTH domain
VEFAIFDDMKIVDTMPDALMLEELGRRARQQRVGMDMTQAMLAEATGISARTIERFEAGASIQLDNLIRILRALGLSTNLDQLVPDSGVRPLQLVQSKAGARRRASPRRKSGAPRQNWVWGDET